MLSTLGSQGLGFPLRDRLRDPSRAPREGFGSWGLGFWGLGFRVLGLGVWVLGFRGFGV